MGVVFKDKIKVDKNFINDLITKSWEESESLQNQIDSIEVDSAIAAKTVKLLKELLTSYYVFTGCLENIENEPSEVIAVKPVDVIPETPKALPKKPINDIVTPEVGILSEAEDNATSEPFEYFVDFDEPIGEPLTDDDLYN